MRSIVYSVVIIIVCALVVISEGCTNSSGEGGGTDSLAIRRSIAAAPVIAPDAAIKKMHVEKGFAVSLVAAEPLIAAPVAMTFDEKGRIWVVEMEGYMPDTSGTGESAPTGKIVILDDKNGDGMMDERKVFLDSLVLPRAICLIENGILVAESPKLWYYKMEGDRPVKKTLVDDKYAEGGNVEHQPNGLLRALDNWIYNAKSNKRYRKKGDQWLVEKTHFRGQWGITQDDYGRLYYNTNSENLIGDYFSPGLGATNKNQRSVAGFVKNLVPDNRVYPVRPTPGVNRGYMDGVLDDSLRLVNFTAACGPVIYNGDLFDKEYYGNAFVAEPAANLIKRNVLNHEGYKIEGRQAYYRQEFLASEDERFRPVNLYTGPDGALYVVDMYRGIIQHKTYLTPYLKNEIKERALTAPLSCGRIYKVAPREHKNETKKFAADTTNLVALLAHPNGWWRHKAQQLLVDRKMVTAAPALRAILPRADKPLALIHALWTMEGLNLLEVADVQPLLAQKTWAIRMQALSVLPSLIKRENYQQILPVLRQMIAANDALAAPYIAFLAHSIQPFNAAAAQHLLLALTKKYGASPYVADAVISNLQNKEAAFYKEVLSFSPDTAMAINKQLKKVIDQVIAAKNNPNLDQLKKQYPKGVLLFQSICQTCHGADGNGVKALAPPLNHSQWVVGDKNNLIRIVLYGLTGPVKVGDKVYKAPEINGDMPGIGGNKEFTDGDIAQLLSFIRNSWSNKAEKIDSSDIKKIRNEHKGRQAAFTAEELGRFNTDGQQKGIK